MASRKSYECFVCKRQGFEDVQVFLDGKDDQGKTIYKNEDMTPHYHQARSSTANEVVHQGTQSQSQPQQQSQPKTEYDKSVDNGISAFSMMTSLIRLVEQNQKQLVTLTEKVDHLTKLVYAMQSHQQQK